MAPVYATKPKQDVSVSGAFIHAEVRDPVLLGWPKEALAKLAGRYDEAYREVVREFHLDASLQKYGEQHPEAQQEETEEEEE